MEIFKSIDWNPSINDIIDDEFVSGERLERESVMHRILRGTFSDPFADIHDDYKDLVTQADIDAYEQEKEEKEKKKEEEKQKKEEMKKEEEKKKEQETAALLLSSKAVEEEEEKESAEETSSCPKNFIKYYPGIVKTSLRFPRLSCLGQEQQSACLRVLLRFSGSGKPDISKINREDLEIYTKFQSSISAEQTEFLQLAKDHWKGTDLTLIREDLINRKWKVKMKYVQQLPRYYVENGTIPLTSDKDIKACFNATLLEKGKIPRLLLPALERRVKLCFTPTKAERKYFTFTEPWKEKNLITEDPHCQHLVETNDIDLVLSSSGLSCLANNLDSSYANSWALPVLVKEINEKRVIFIDKALPQTARNVCQKNSWVVKYILKSLLLHPNHNHALNLENSREETADPMSEDTDDADETERFADMETSSSTKPSTSGTNFVYNLFTIGSCGLPQNEMMKNKVERDYKILVRTKIDGVERMGKEQIKYAMVAPKLENQLGLGAEAVSIEEASKQWAALTFRPDTGLVRVRINPSNGEVIQYERRTAMSVNNEMTRLYSVKGEDCLGVIYNVADTMTKMTGGRYLIKHTVRNGAFAAVYKETETSGKNAIDLHALYGDEQFLTIPNVPWPLIDKAVALPMHECFNRMPAMFHPNRRKVVEKKKGPDVKRNVPQKNQGKVGKKKKKKGSPVKKGMKSPEKLNSEKMGG